MKRKQTNSQRKKNETLPNSHLETRSKPEEENTGVKTGDADNHAERIYKRRFVEDDIIARDWLDKRYKEFKKRFEK